MGFSFYKGGGPTKWIAGTTALAFLVGLAAAYTRHKTVMLAGNILWLLLTLSLLCLYLGWQKHLIKQLENLTGERSLPLTPFFLRLEGIQQAETALRTVAEKMDEYQIRLIHQTARQAGESFRLIVANCTDGLTGVANRKYLDSRLTEMIKNQKPFSIIMLDIDHFKKVNDTYGHPAGDEVLKQFAKAISKTVRPGDLVARYGGEEFAVICLDAMHALQVAERIRKTIEANPIQTGAGAIKITASLGVARWGKEDTVEGLVKRADDFLYKAKQEGRNRVKGE